MENPSKIQPVDGYVKQLLQDARERYGLNIDLENPTREQRLEAALAMKDEENGFYSMEIMVGERVSRNDPLVMLLLIREMFPEEPRRFYDGFAHRHYPKQD